MRAFRPALALLLLLLAAHAGAAPKDAVVRVKSHGCSATIAWTGPGQSLVLGCAHAYMDAEQKMGPDGRLRRTGRMMRDVPMTIDAPSPVAGAQRTPGGIRLLRVDARRDLSLVLIPVGPLPYCCPVAPRGHRPGRCISVGYDQMKIPPTVAWATLLDSGHLLTHTREHPGHGRSGGGLIDQDAGVLIGVVSGYECSGVGPDGRPRPRVGDRGRYASHQAILEFLAGPGVAQGPAMPPFRPMTQPILRPMSPGRPCPT